MWCRHDSEAGVLLGSPDVGGVRVALAAEAPSNQAVIEEIEADGHGWGSPITTGKGGKRVT